MTPSPTSYRGTLDPLVWLAAAFAFGIIFSSQMLASGWVLLAAGMIACAIGLLLRHQTHGGILLLIAFAALGGFCYQAETGSTGVSRLKRFYDEGRIESGTPVELEGTIIGGPEPAPDGFFLVLDTERIIYRGEPRDGAGRARLFIPIPSAEAGREWEQMELRNGRQIRVACAPVREDRYLNPGVTPRRELMDRQRIDVTATVKSPLLVETREQGGFAELAAPIFETRKHLIEEFRTRFSADTAGVLIASMLGDKYFLDRRTAETFREGGAFHVLVISGLHVTFLGGVVLLIVRAFSRNKALQFAITCSSLWIFTLAIGAESPAVRASLMFTIVMFAGVIHCRARLLNALGAGALILLVWRPSDLFDPSFQLTFASVAGITAMAFPLIEKLRGIGEWLPTAERPFPPNVTGWLRRTCEFIYWNPRVWEIESGRQVWSAGLFKSRVTAARAGSLARRVMAFAIEGVLVSLAVQIWLLPLLVYHFHRVSVASVLLNLWVGPLMAVQSLSAVATVAVGQASVYAAMPFVVLTESINRLMMWLPTLVVSWDAASLRVPIYSGMGRWIYAAYFAPVAVAAALIYRWEPFAIGRYVGKLRYAGVMAAATIAAVGGIIIFHPGSEPAAGGKLRIDFLDVGQGDATLITFPTGETMLVDGGGALNFRPGADDQTEEFEPDIYRVGEAVVSEVLWERGYSRVDHIVATHADTDHIQGLIDVAKNFEIGAAYFPPAMEPTDETLDLRSILQRRGIPENAIYAGTTLAFGDATVEVLYPERDVDNFGSENDRSLVLMITYNGRRILLTGDIESVAEEELVRNTGQLRADVVKVPHHGSRSSSTREFVNAVAPKYAIIPVGRRSLFGHPHGEVVERWRDAGAALMTAGEKGMVSIIIDEHGLHAATFLDGIKPRKDQ